MCEEGGGFERHLTFVYFMQKREISITVERRGREGEQLTIKFVLDSPKGPGKRGHIVADTLLPTQMFPRLPERATFVADTNFQVVSGTQKMFLILFRNILCPQQMFPSCAAQETA